MIAIYTASERQRQLVSAALPYDQVVGAGGDWSRFEWSLASATGAVVWLDSLRDDGSLARVSTLSSRAGSVPTVLVTRKDAEGVRRLVGMPQLEVIWPEEVAHALQPALRRARTSGVFQRLALAVERARSIPGHLRHALVRVCRGHDWPASLARMAADVGCDRRTLWRQWRKLAGPDADLRLEDILDWVLLLRALSLKWERCGWAEVSRTLHVHETTLGRVAKRLTGQSLTVLEGADAAALADTLLHSMLEPVLGAHREGHSAADWDVPLLCPSPLDDNVTAAERAAGFRQARSRSQPTGYTSWLARAEGSAMADEGLGFGQGGTGQTAVADADAGFTSGTAARGTAVPGGTKPGGAAAAAAPRAGVGTESAVGEVMGDPAAPSGGTETTPGNAHAEVGSSGGESGEEFAEATAEQMAAAESGEETALSDLQGIEGYEPPRPVGEGAALNGQLLQEAGEAAEGEQQEFLPVLAALAPALISTVGPAVAKGIGKILSPRARKVIARRKPVAGAAAKAAVTAVTGGAGRSNLLSLIAKLLESAESAPESGMEVDQAFVQQAAAALEVIVDIDDRVRITQTTQIPWRRLCALRIEFPSGAIYRGTGFLIGPRAVATAGHCVYLHNQGGWARKVQVIPGCNGTAKPYGQAESSAFRSVTGWVNERKPESDYGCIILPSGSFGGSSLGSFGFAAFDAQALLAQPAVMAGYPGDKPFAELWGASRFIKTVTAKTLIYNTASMGGQSGAPVYIKRNGQRYVVGIHNYGATTGNSATRVTQPVYDRLRAWSQI